MTPFAPAIQVHHAARSTTIVVRLPEASAVRVDLQADHVTIDADIPVGHRRIELPLASRVDERRATMHFAAGVLRVFLPNAASGAGAEDASGAGSPR